MTSAVGFSFLQVPRRGRRRPPRVHCSLHLPVVGFGFGETAANTMPAARCWIAAVTRSPGGRQAASSPPTAATARDEREDQHLGGSSGVHEVGGPCAAASGVSALLSCANMISFTRSPVRVPLARLHPGDGP